MKCPFVIKKCNRCGKLLVSNKLNFHKGEGKHGLCNICKNCRNKKNRQDAKISKKIKSIDNPFDNIDIDKTWNHCPFCIQVCTVCQDILVANESNFRKNKTGKYGLTGKCIKCLKEWDKEYKKDNKEKINIYNKQYSESHREENKQRSKEHYHNNKEYYKDFHKLWYEDNKEKVKEQQKEYYEKNKDKAKETNKQWREKNPEKCLNYHNKRRQLEESQGSGISKDQWLEMMAFFEFKCAYSGITLNKDNRTIDHIISLNKEGKHEIWNCVPMIRRLNSSKNNKDMVSWYKQQEFFDIDRLMKIYEWQEYAFEKWRGK